MREIIIVTIEIENRHSYPVTKALPRGTVVEIADPRSTEQHAMVARDYTVTIPPRDVATLHVEAFCFARRRDWPRGAPGNLTPYRFSGPVLDQEDLWRQYGY